LEQAKADAESAEKSENSECLIAISENASGPKSPKALSLLSTLWLDVNARLEHVLSAAGLRVAVLRAFVPTQKREEWYDRQLESGVEVVVCHPKLVETGLDLLAFPTLYFYQTGYSLHTLRQASRRSWRIGQRHPVRVKFLTYKGTMQETCLRLMGKKMLVALMMDVKFSGEGLQSLDAEEDLMSAMARELVEKAGVGECADQVWRQLDRERSKQMGPTVQVTEAERSADSPPELLEPAGQPGIHLVPSTPRKSRKDSPPWPATATTEAPIQLSCSVDTLSPSTTYSSAIFARGIRMSQGPFSPSQFIPTKWSTAEEKARFGNALLHFIDSGFTRNLFTDRLYSRLSNCFGHIAHYNSTQFSEEWFSSLSAQVRFLEHALRFPCYSGTSIVTATKSCSA
jgi:hypothetical protein